MQTVIFACIVATAAARDVDSYYLYFTACTPGAQWDTAGNPLRDDIKHALNVSDASGDNSVVASATDLISRVSCAQVQPLVHRTVSLACDAGITAVAGVFEGLAATAFIGLLVWLHVLLTRPAKTKYSPLQASMPMRYARDAPLP